MTNQWAKSYSYREALDALLARFKERSQQDRIVNHELMPNLASIDGYLFAINAAPAEISPTEWLGDLLPLIQLEGEKPAEAVNVLISYALHSKSRMAQQKYALPDETDPLQALAPASPLNSFSHGFEVGYRRVESVWSASIAQELRGELQSQVFALKFFSSTEHANNYLKQRQSVMRPDQLAEQVLANLPKAADLHVRLGMAMEMDRGIAH
ncbi:UPF0149 family protein [Reinekea sp. G2M2-21]|uniref:UPF0149 family protein n=1 Tax=Reinekea sp. G2M2-21 TaxID=2788942 RepID=UPI0018AAB374|nr:UPF0149 family protein [Reinekea sp. G2M2-21]